MSSLKLSDKEVVRRFCHKVLVPKALEFPYPLSCNMRTFRLKHESLKGDWRFDYPTTLVKGASGKDSASYHVLMCGDGYDIVVERFEKGVCVNERKVSWQELKTLLKEGVYAN